jgi:hypothetical protein
MRRTLGLVVALIAATAGCGDGGEQPPADSGSEVPAAGVLSRDPYLGVSCPEPNRFACDRVGLAVWLEEPAEAIDATVEGRAFALDDPDWSGPLDGGVRRMFAGFLQPAGLVDGPLALTADDGPDRWIGRHEVSAQVELRIVRADGTTDVTRTEVGLSAGWG